MYWRKFGKQLRALHQITHEAYGLEYNNHIGTLQQDNKWHADWSDFFIQQRLRPQLNIAGNALEASVHRDFDTLFAMLPDIVPEGKPELVHGDLWKGNFMVDDSGDVVLIDPALYYGRGEVDLAMSSLFGGFDAGFYQAYTESRTIDKNMESRLSIYKLYPLLVHLNMFGTSYAGPIISILKLFK